MRLSAPRVAPLRDEDLSPEQAEALQPVRNGKLGVLNIFRTLAHAPKALSRFNQWGGYVLSRRNDLPARDREIVILRVGYEAAVASTIEAIKRGADAGWSPADAVLIRATDELHTDHFISDSTWNLLKQHYTEKQCMDLVFTTGQYTQVSMMLNTFGVQLDAGQVLDPELKGY